jgi:large subunit ribosomal protein L1
MKRSKRYGSASAKVKRDGGYGLVEAIKLVKENATAKFDETIELSANLGVDPRHADQQIRGTVSLPKGIGKTVRVIVFAQGDDAVAAKQAGADLVGGEDLAEKIQGGFLDFDVALAAPDMMRHVGKLGKVLGPRGLMPNPKTGTVTRELAKGVQEFKAGRIEYRANKEGIINSIVGKASFKEEDLTANIWALLRALLRSRPPTAKGSYVKTLTLSSTMGPGVPLDVNRTLQEAREA